MMYVLSQSEVGNILLLPHPHASVFFFVKMSITLSEYRSLKELETSTQTGEGKILKTPICQATNNM